MAVLTQNEGMLLLAAFGCAMLILVWWGAKREHGLDGFLAANRDVSVGHGALSIAVSWIWAPAVFICSLQAYTKGLPGVFWFTFPNVLCFFTFAPLAIRFRRSLPHGYTLPEYIAFRFPASRRAHLALLVVFFGYQLGAVIINTLAGGLLLNAVAGIKFSHAVLGMSTIAISYSLLGGLRASILTDVIQMAMLLLVALALVPWSLQVAGGSAVLLAGLGGFDGSHRNLLDPWIAFTMGIPMTLGLLAGPISDQMFFQRAQAIREASPFRTFIIAGLLFAVVPVVLSSLGFIGAGLAQTKGFSVSDPQLVGPAVVAELLPRTALYLFCLMAFAGLCSTLDSAYCAISALGSIDVYRRYVNSQATDAQLLRASRFSMLALGTLGTGAALLQPQLLWVFLIYGALAAAGMFPIIFSLCWSGVTERGVFWGVCSSLCLGLPLSMYANISERPVLIVLAAVLSTFVGGIVCILLRKTAELEPFMNDGDGEQHYRSHTNRDTQCTLVAMPGSHRDPGCNVELIRYERTKS
ncbi:MAG: hypothetical protein KDD69_17690 [Bdellovibrionales bacterium]|nr:hypothetical protein [Bdellovibrionales bacterium]